MTRSEADEKYREKARLAARRAIRDGKLFRPTRCQKCKERKGRIEAHHPDYDKPLEVEWLCCRCHAGEHRGDPRHREIFRRSDGKNHELTTEESAAYLNYTLGTFYEKVHEIPHRKERGRLYFTISALDEFKAAQSTDHVPEPAA